MASVSPHGAFTTGEILREVIRQIDGPKTLSRCARVSRMWHDESIPILWRGSHDQASPWRTPEIAFLAELARSPYSFLYHVGFIDKLSLLYGDAPVRFDDLKTIFLPHLWSTFRGSMVLVNLDSGLMAEDYMKVLVKPTLRSLSLFGGHYSNGFLRSLKEKCALRLLLIANRWGSGNITSEALQDFLRPCSLEYFEWAQELEDAINLDVCRAILETPSLRHACFSTNFTNFQSVSWSDVSSNLCSLDISCPIPKLTSLIQHLPNLESFRISVTTGDTWDVGPELLEPLSGCHQLRELFIYADIDTTILEPTALLQFAEKCRLIHTLDIDGSGRHNANGEPDEFNISALTAALQLWPGLFSLNFMYPTTFLGSDEISLIATSCPMLGYMSIFGSVDASVFLNDRAPVFPRLRSFCPTDIVLTISSMYWSDYELIIDDLRENLFRCIPKLASIEDSVVEIRDETGKSQDASSSILKQLRARRDPLEDLHDGPSVRREIATEISSR